MKSLRTVLHHDNSSISWINRVLGIRQHAPERPRVQASKVVRVSDELTLKQL
jgi:hypothetical protein